MQALVRSASTGPDNQIKRVRRAVTGPGWVVALVLALVAALPAGAAAASSASGPSSGVHVDPGSPAGKEYAIPLGSARGDGTNGTSKLFGAGITRSQPPAGPSSSSPSPSSSVSSTPASPATSAASTAPRKHTVDRHHHHRRRIGGAGSRAPAVPTSLPVAARTPSPQRLIGTSSGSSAGVTWMLAAAVIVLLLGGAGGVVLTRRGRGTSPSPS